jgi:hypothetical protein
MASPIAATLLTLGLLRNNPAWRSVRGALIASTVLTWIAFVLLTVQMMTLLPQHGGQLGPEVQVDWSSRFLVVVYAAWVASTAACAAKVESTQA